MFKSERSGDLNGFLDAGSKMTGELEFADTFRVDGAFSGTIRSRGDLVVGAEGAVDGQIFAGRVFVSGTVRGEIHAEDRLEISQEGRVNADVTTPALVIEEGAFLEGRCSMERAVTEASGGNLGGRSGGTGRKKGRRDKSRRAEATTKDEVAQIGGSQGQGASDSQGSGEVGRSGSKPTLVRTPAGRATVP